MNYTQDTLHLQGHVVVTYDAPQFTLRCEQMDLCLCTKEKENQFEKSLPSRLQCERAQICFQDRKSGLERFLTCHGELFVDRNSSRIYLDSPTIDGKVNLENQVTYEDAWGEIRADAMVIDYAMEESKFCLKKIEMHHNVRLESRPSEKEKPLSIQCALADELEYQPDSETVILKAVSPAKVLFLDQEQETKISCDQILLNRSKRSVEAWGSVHLSLQPQELNKLCKQCESNDG
jgi:hypothetical protein